MVPPGKLDCWHQDGILHAGIEFEVMVWGFSLPKNQACGGCFLAAESSCAFCLDSWTVGAGGGLDNLPPLLSGGHQGGLSSCWESG